MATIKQQIEDLVDQLTLSDLVDEDNKFNTLNKVTTKVYALQGEYNRSPYYQKMLADYAAKSRRKTLIAEKKKALAREWANRNIEVGNWICFKKVPGYFASKYAQVTSLNERGFQYKLGDPITGELAGGYTAEQPYETIDGKLDIKTMSVTKVEFPRVKLTEEDLAV